MAVPAMIPFTIGALGCAILLGLGNGGVFKLVPQYFPFQTGTVTGLVGAAGGLGGFFPPIELGIFKELTGSYALGFVLLSCFALFCAWVLGRTFLRIPTPTHQRAYPPLLSDRPSATKTQRISDEGEGTTNN